MQCKPRVIFLSLILALSIVLLGPKHASAATYHVNVKTDGYDETTNVFCTLRMAIVAANENRPVGACPAGSSTQMDIIHLASGSYQLDIVETSGGDITYKGDLDISGNLTIIGNSAENTIIQGSLLQDRIFHIKSSGVVVLRNLKILEGKALTDQPGVSSAGLGGGILNEGNLTVDSLIITGNNGPTAGGGIYNKEGAKLLVKESTIQNNTSEAGGGIFNNGILEIQNSLIYDNRATRIGGGLGSNLGATDTKLFNVTVSTNQAPIGSGIFSQSHIEIRNSTIASNIKSSGAGIGAGIEIARNTTGYIANSIVARHTINCDIQSSVFYSLGGNLENGNTCAFSASGNLPDTDPGMALSLGKDYGGKTMYYALEPGSAAENAGNQSYCMSHDQRGVFYGRKDGACDIGSFELSAKEEILSIYLPTVQR